MRIIIRAVGKAAGGEEGLLAERYAKRAAQFARAQGISSILVQEIAESRARSAAERKAAEAIALGHGVNDRAVRVALDERGKSLPSEAFAAQLAQWRGQGREDIVFFIGGADGLAPDFVQAAHQILSLGSATWPHLLARAMLLEQIYRSFTILSGHPYHRA